MSDLPIVGDAGPLIGLARVGLLDLLRRLYGRVWIPDQVLDELRISDDRPGSRVLHAAIKEGWLEAVSLPDTEDLGPLRLALDAGEAAAILLATQNPCRFLLLDERRGRTIARSRGIQVIGTGGVLLAAKKQEFLPRVSDALDRLGESGYRLSPELRHQILTLAGEGPTR